jgi:hypothetical protein
MASSLLSLGVERFDDIQPSTLFYCHPIQHLVTEVEIGVD